MQLSLLPSSKTFSLPQKRKPILIKYSLSSPPGSSPFQPLTYFPSPEIYLFWGFHINVIIYYAIFYFWILSLRIIFLRFIYTVAHSNILFIFLFIVEQYSIVGIYHVLFIPLYIYGFWFHLFATVNNAAMRSHVCFSKPRICDFGTFMWQKRIEFGYQLTLRWLEGSREFGKMEGRREGGKERERKKHKSFRELPCENHLTCYCWF